MMPLDSDNSSDPKTWRLVGISIPDQWKLCQLAAMVSNELPGPDQSSLRENAAVRLDLALEILRQAETTMHYLTGDLENQNRHAQEVGKLIGALKVGTHNLPEFTLPWSCSGKTIPLDDFIEAVVGLSKAPDRMLWWRAFMEDRLKREEVARRAVYSLDGPDMIIVPQGYKLEKGKLEETLKNQRENGICRYTTALELAVDYRRWRLTMTSPSEKRPLAYVLSECVQPVPVKKGPKK